MTKLRITYRAVFETEAFEKDGGALPEGVNKDSSQPATLCCRRRWTRTFTRESRAWAKLFGSNFSGNPHQDTDWRVKDVTHHVDSQDVSILLEGQASFGAVGITRITYLAYEKDRKQLRKTVESSTIPRVGKLSGSTSAATQSKT
jgi:hypothetical protein